MAVRATRVAVGTSAIPLVGARSDYKMGSSALVRNRGSVAVYVGASGVTTSTGFQLDPGETMTVDLDDGESPYAISGTAGQSCHVFEQGV